MISLPNPSPTFETSCLFWTIVLNTIINFPNPTFQISVYFELDLVVHSFIDKFPWPKPYVSATTFTFNLTSLVNKFPKPYISDTYHVYFGLHS